ncbi:MAG: CvpA family protein [Desulfamplus sp.]|nr:CvpA family protein [Desulfamplus sp.]
MNIFDIFIVVVVSFGLIRGFFRGFIKEVASIVGVIAGFYGAYTYYKLLVNYKLFTDYLSQWISKWEIYGNIICFCLIFFAIVILTAMIANLIRLLLKIVFLGWVDKLFGIIFGACKGFLVASVVFLTLTAFMQGQPEFITKSTLAPYVAHISEMATIFISKELKGDLKIKIERIKEIWKQQKLSIQEKMTEKITRDGTQTIAVIFGEIKTAMRLTALLKIVEN